MMVRTIERRHAGHDRDDTGMVLILVLWSLILLSLIAATAISVSRTEIKARASLNQAAQLQVRADGFVRLAALRLTDRRAVTDGAVRVPTNGTPTVCRDGDILIETRIEDAAGRVDLNAASQPLLELLLAGVGIAPEEASSLAARIVDYRDPDDIPGIGGAELTEYLAAGRTFGPKNSVFDSVDELDQVLGVSPELLERLRPLVTVHSRLPGIDPAVASNAVVKALSGAAPGSPAGLPQILAMRSPGRVFHIVVIAGHGARRASRAATVELVRGSREGFQVRKWGSAGSSKTADEHKIVDNCFGPRTLPR